MTLKELRNKRGLSRREVAERSGINLRSLQDYEQGHKDISRAKGETLYRLSLAIGCTVEQLLEDHLPFLCVDEEKEKVPMPEPKVPKAVVEAAEIFSQQYKISGRWRYDGEICYLLFLYEGRLIKYPFIAEFTEVTLPWLVEAAAMEIESYVDHELFLKACRELGGGDWDEW